MLLPGAVVHDGDILPVRAVLRVFGEVVVTPGLVCGADVDVEDFLEAADASELDLFLRILGIGDLAPPSFLF